MNLKMNGRQLTHGYTTKKSKQDPCSGSSSSSSYKELRHVKKPAPATSDITLTGPTIAKCCFGDLLWFRTRMHLDLAVTDKPFSCGIFTNDNWRAKKGTNDPIKRYRKSQKEDKWPNQKIPDYPQVWHSGHWGSTSNLPSTPEHNGAWVVRIHKRSFPSQKLSRRLRRDPHSKNITHNVTAYISQTASRGD